MSSQKHYFSGPSTQRSNNYYLHTQETYRHDPNLNERRNLTPRNEKLDSNDQTSKSPLRNSNDYPRKSQDQSILARAQRNLKNQSQQQQGIIEVLTERIKNLEQQNTFLWEPLMKQFNEKLNEMKQEIQDVKASQRNQINICDSCKSKEQFDKQQEIDISRLKGLLNSELVKSMNDKLIRFDKDHISLQKELKALNQKIQSILNEKQSELKLSSPNLNLVDQDNIESGKLKKIIIQEMQDDFKQPYFQTPGQGKDSQKFKEEPCQLTNQLKNDQKEKRMQETEKEQPLSTKTKIDNISKSIYNSDNNKKQVQ